LPVAGRGVIHRGTCNGVLPIPTEKLFTRLWLPTTAPAGTARIARGRAFPLRPKTESAACWTRPKLVPAETNDQSNQKQKGGSEKGTIAMTKKLPDRWKQPP